MLAGPGDIGVTALYLSDREEAAGKERAQPHYEDLGHLIECRDAVMPTIKLFVEFAQSKKLDQSGFFGMFLDHALEFFSDNEALMERRIESALEGE